MTRCVSSRSSLLLLALPCFILLIQSPRLHRLADFALQTSPFSGQRAVEQAFQPTSRESSCLLGLRPVQIETPTRLDDNTDFHPVGFALEDPIPNLVHFVFLLPAVDDGGSFDFLGYLSVRSAIVTLKPQKVFFHYSYVVTGSSPPYSAGRDPILNNRWIRKLLPHIELVRHEASAGPFEGHIEHLADILRLDILLQYGGIYMDTDSFALKPFDDVRLSPAPHDAVLGNEGGNRAGLCNAIMAARPGSAFLRRWRETYEGSDLSKEWNYHSVVLPKELANDHPNEVCELPPDAFFWPTWTWRHVEWMHEPINRSERERCLQIIRENEGALFPRQLAYHAWGHMARDRFLGRLSPRVVREEDTRFNLLMRRFLDDDD